MVRKWPQSELHYVGRYSQMPTLRNMPLAPQQQRLLQFVRERGVVRPRDLEEIGIARSQLVRLCDAGLIARRGRGLYAAADAKPLENDALVEVTRRVDGSVVCLLSALRFHGLTTQAPHEVWIAIGHKQRPPKIDCPPVRWARFSGKAHRHGVCVERVGKTGVPVYTPAKTVADCFKFRNKVGIDVAMESLRDCLEQRMATADQLWAAAEACRMQNVMRPYLEAVH